MTSEEIRAIALEVAKKHWFAIISQPTSSTEVDRYPAPHSEQSIGDFAVALIAAITAKAEPVIPALLYEAYDYGQFAADFDQPLAKPIRKAIRDMLTSYASPDEALEMGSATTARSAFWKAALGNNTKLANLAKAAIAEAEKSRPPPQSSYQEYKEHKRKKLEEAGFLKFPLRDAAPLPDEVAQRIAELEAENTNLKFRHQECCRSSLVIDK